MRPHLLLAPAAVLLALGLAPAAFGSSSPSPSGGAGSSAHSDLHGTTTTSAVVTCHSGERVVSGGYTSSTGGSAAVNRRISATRWKVVMEGSSEAQVYAYCSPVWHVSTVEVDVTFSGEANQNFTLSPQCGPGKRAVSGGWAFNDGAENTPVYISRPVGQRTWRIVAPHGLASSLKAFVYCVSGDSSTVTTYQATTNLTSTRSVAPHGTSGTPSATASCPNAGQHTLGGGFETTPAPDWANTDGPDTFFNATWRSDARAWTASAVNYSGYDGGAITAFILCH